MAILNVWRARASANEASAIGSLRSITSGQIAYSATCGIGHFAPDLPMLGATVASPRGFLTPDLTAALTVQKSGFTVDMGVQLNSNAGPLDCNGSQTQTGYYASAKPVLFGTSGNRSFATNSPSNVIWQVFDRNPPGEPFGAPASPVR
jgi:hypothetical protein